MYKFSRKSQYQLETCDINLQQVMQHVIKHVDFTALEGYRSNERQDTLFKEGKSKLKGGQSKHNQGLAVDIAPYPIDYSNDPKNLARWYYLAGCMKATAQMLGMKLRWGGDWNSNNIFSDQNFDDLGHFELLEDIEDDN